MHSVGVMNISHVMDIMHITSDVCVYELEHRAHVLGPEQNLNVVVTRGEQQQLVRRLHVLWQVRQVFVQVMCILHRHNIILCPVHDHDRFINKPDAFYAVREHAVGPVRHGARQPVEVAKRPRARRERTHEHYAITRDTTLSRQPYGWH